jgi:transposase InsO family protein
MSSVQQNIIKHKVGLLNLAVELGNVSKACQMMGMSRDTFYRYRNARQAGGVEALLDANRRKPILKNRVEPSIENAVVKFATDQPAMGQSRAANELRKLGIVLSAAGIRSIWLRNGLETFPKRLKALEAMVAVSGQVLTESQVRALEQKAQDDVAHGEIETAHPGYLGSQDTFYVGTLKGVGRVYQQTFVDTYSKWAAAKLYSTKSPITAADLLNDRVLPAFEAQGMGIIRILTDRGTEYCGKPEKHDFQLYLALNDIEHTKTKVRHPQTNGICERFHKTILQEFYQVAFRKKIYRTIEELQVDLDHWITYYNHDRTHQGKMCNGRTPMQTMLDAKELYNEKVNNLN